VVDPVDNPRIRPLASNDLEEIVSYLDQRSSDAADRILVEFQHATELLSEMPRAGTIRRKRGRLKGVRSWPLTSFGPYLLFYMPLPNGIEVLRVLHGSRNIERHLREGLK
jgi:toxin ParE1/3/4